MSCKDRKRSSAFEVGWEERPEDMSLSINCPKTQVDLHSAGNYLHLASDLYQSMKICIHG